jgi:hypothetical protein
VQRIVQLSARLATAAFEQLMASAWPRFSQADLSTRS